jgi:hypothetical protein
MGLATTGAGAVSIKVLIAKTAQARIARRDLPVVIAILRPEALQQPTAECDAESVISPLMIVGLAPALLSLVGTARLGPVSKSSLISVAFIAIDRLLSAASGRGGSGACEMDRSMRTDIPAERGNFHHASATETLSPGSVLLSSSWEGENSQRYVEYSSDSRNLRGRQQETGFAEQRADAVCAEL